MQTIAREFNLSETVFLTRSDNPAHTARGRIFTPTRELPFAGHPVAGAAILLADLKSQAVVGVRDVLVILELPGGVVRVGVKLRDGTAPYAEFDAPRLPTVARIEGDVEDIAAAVGLLPSEIGLANHVPRRASAGAAFALVPVATREAIERAAPNGAYWAQTFSDTDVVGAYLYTRDCLLTSSAFHARMFAPDAGIPEDPATGSAAIGLAAALLEFDGLPDGTHRRVVEQGYTMGRPSLLTLMVEVTAGALTGVRLGGHAVRMSSGTLGVLPGVVPTGASSAGTGAGP
jgi:trans-2,3-dihydro-3-hydroxyanthranilate isomerase